MIRHREVIAPRTILLIALLIFISLACSLFDRDNPNDPGDVSGTEQSPNTENIPSSEGGATFDLYVETVSQLKVKGDEYTENGMPLQAEYYYSIAGASISALRFAIDNLIVLKGGGDGLAAVVGDAYGDWDTIASISYVSPYPYYFEGLVYHVQGQMEEASECYRNAIQNPNFPEGGLSFYFLNDLSIDELLVLKEDLVAMENSIYATYTPTFSSLERNPLYFSDAYLRAAALEALRQHPADTVAAQTYYSMALKVNPFDPKNFTALALLAIESGDVESAVYYINEGLWIDPEDSTLNQLADQFLQYQAGGAQ